MVDNVLDLKSVSLSYDGCDRKILDNVSLSIKRGEFCALLGNNGAGKSSLLNIIGGVRKNYSGSIKFFSKRLASCNQLDLASEIVMLTQNSNETLFGDLTVLENCLLWDSRFQTMPLFISDTLLKEYREYLKLFHARLPLKLKQNILSLSGGERQVLSVALALRKIPRLLLLDEHTSALDVKMSASVMEVTHQNIKKYNVTAMMITHNLEHALLYASRIVVMSQGKIVCDLQNDKSRSQEVYDKIISYF